VEGKTNARRIFDLRNSRFQEYDLEGPVQPEMSLLPISYNRTTGLGCYAMRMEPGAVTIAHDHPGYEEFLVLEGELIDSDGTRFKAGDFVSFEPGTHHNSRTETGCLLVVFEWRPPAD
jgi:quercetin dioxygenase-like cupin family protein